MKNHLYLPFVLLFVLFISCEKEEGVEPIDTYWQTDKPAFHGFNTSDLQTAIDNARQSSSLQALLIVRNNKLLVEEYFNGRQVNDLFQLRSITKNFTSALTGIAIEEGILESVDNPIASHFPDIEMIGGKEQITMRHLLNMTSGLEWSENNEIIPLINHEIPNAISTILSRPSADMPDNRFNYNSLSPHIASYIIRLRSNTDFDTYAEEELLEPLGIGNYAWEKDTENRVWGGFGLQLTARDLAKFGQLYLNKGTWEGKEVLSADWVELSLSSQITISDAVDYSLHWWVNSSSIYGYGYGGQSLILVPDKDLIIIGLQEYRVLGEQETQQWKFFSEEVLQTILNALD